jgi:DNA-binding transcriptional MerR regulator
MDKTADAYRTISEVAEELALPQHVLRFWETRFPQIRPLKRGGGRRYYRPGDIVLLRAIQQLLYGQGFTIKGVQRILKEQKTRDPADTSRAGKENELAHLPAALFVDYDQDSLDFSEPVEERAEEFSDGAKFSPIMERDLVPGEIEKDMDRVGDQTEPLASSLAETKRKLKAILAELLACQEILQNSGE